MGLPGPINRATRTVGSSSILPGWVGVDAAAEMERRLRLPVHVENDANLGALAEYVWGSGQGHSDVIYVKLSSGVGAGLLLGGRLHEGASGTAGEIGHTPPSMGPQSAAAAAAAASRRSRPHAPSPSSSARAAASPSRRTSCSS